MKTLADLEINERGTIVKITASEKLNNQLTDLGFTFGCQVEVLGHAPLGDPMLIKIRGSQIALRKSDAKNIEIV